MLGVKSGRTGMGNLDFEVKTFSENDGEAKAGQTILDTLAKADACDVVVLVARWFGGTYTSIIRLNASTRLTGSMI